MQRIATIFQTGEHGSPLQIKLDFAIFICFVIIIMYVLLPAGERGFPLQIIHNIDYIKTFLSNIRLHQGASDERSYGLFCTRKDNNITDKEVSAFATPLFLRLKF